MIDVHTFLGRPFVHGVTDCYTLVRDFYQQIFNITLTDYARPDRWWETDLDLYMTNFRDEGFDIVEVTPQEYQIGDLFLMAIDANKANHAGIYIGEGKILHHLAGRFSEVSTYRGFLRKNTVATIRHKDVQVDPESFETVELIDMLPAHLQRRLRNPDEGT